MAGIFPTGGTDARNTQNAELDVRVVELCAALFYRLGCNPRFDPLSTNAIISEIANVVNDLGLNYDCNRLDNMSQAIQRAILTKNLPFLDPDMDDTIRGSYDGIEGQAFIKRILELAPAGLDQVTTLADQDSVYVSVGGVGRRIPFAQLKALVQPSTQAPGVEGSYWALGAPLAMNPIFGGNIDGTNLRAFIAQGAWEPGEGQNPQYKANGVVVHVVKPSVGVYSFSCLFIKDKNNNWWGETNAWGQSESIFNPVINGSGLSSMGAAPFVSIGSAPNINLDGRWFSAFSLNPIGL